MSLRSKLVLLQRAIFLIVCVQFGATQALAADRSLSNLWIIQEDVPSEGDQTLSRGDYLLKQRLLPTGLAELGGEGIPGLALPAGSQLIEAESPNAVVFCDPAIRPQKLLGHGQPCLIDGDRDGRFDGMFLTTSAVKGILMLQGNRPKTPKPINPIPYKRIEPTAFALNLFVGLEYRGNANPVGNHIFQINFGSENSTGSLSQRIVVGKRSLPATQTPLGANFELLSETPNGIKVRVLRAIPVQPFSVAKFTTYRFF